VSLKDDKSASFAALAAQLQADPGVDVTAHTLVERMSEFVPDADGVSLTVRARRGYTTLASTLDWAAGLDELQYSLDEGPCVDVADHSGLVRSGDVARDSRWPTWGPRAAELGVGSLLSVQLLNDRDPHGALNLYSKDVGRFDSVDLIDIAQIYAMHGATALSSARTISNLQTALTSRHTIGLAQGIVMERYALDPERSFEFLRRLSSTHNVKLRDVAAQIVEGAGLAGGAAASMDDAGGAGGAPAPA
jgi:hypothetical protein